jgi:hypothetical protein
MTNFAIPDYILVDFEHAVIASLNENFMATKIRGYIFNFGQSIWRRVGTLGLIKEYKENLKLNSCIGMRLGLALFPYTQYSMNS